MDEEARRSARPSAHHPLRGLSLEQKLPLLMGALIVLLAVCATVGSYLEVRSSAVEAAGDRIESVEKQLQTMLGTSFEGRASALRAFADSATVLKQALRGAQVNPQALDSALNRIRQRSDSGLPIQLWNTRGEVLASTGTTANPQSASLRPPMETAFRDTAAMRVSPFMSENGRITYFVDVPIRDGSRPLGIVRQAKQITGGGNARQLEKLINAGAIYLTNESGDVWLTMGGEAVKPIPLKGFDRTYQTERDGKPVITYATRLPHSPWVAVTEIGMDRVLTRPKRFLESAVVVGGIFALLGMLIAWLVSKRVTAPIRALDTSASRFADGAYDERVSINRADELGRLAQTFNKMAEQVQTAHSELGLRYDEAASLATELEMSNEQLEGAVDIAEAARAEAQEANRVKSEFLATMSHEIRTPINAMIGYTDLLDMGVPGELSEQQTRYVSRIRDSGRHLVSLVDELLDFAKIESREMHVDRTPHSARGAADNAAHALQNAADRKGVTIAIECDSSQAFRGDARRVHQILLNLVNNGIKFTDAGGRITIRCGRAEAPAELHAQGVYECVFIAVTDTGIGIPSDQLTRIFQPFVQVAGGYTRQHGGAGLGLAISQKLANLMQGTITVSSNTGEGATFKLWLPAADTQAGSTGSTSHK